MLWEVSYTCGLVALLTAGFWGLQWLLSLVTVSVKDKAVLITGCDTGFGNMAARELAREGVSVFAACLTESGAQEMSAHPSGNIRGFVMNVTSEESVREGVEVIKKEVPSGGLHCVINNAGVLRGGNIDTMPLSHWKLQLDVNVIGIALVTKHCLPLLRKCSTARIVNVASVAGRLATPGLSAYNASKFAVEGLSDAVRRELAMWGVAVSIIEPGIMKTPLWDVPMKEAEVDEVWNTLSAPLQQLYGKSYFADAHRIAKETVDTFGGDPQRVVNAMKHCVYVKYPRHRYAVGLDTPVWLMLAAMPSWLCDPLLNLVVKQPVPQALK